MLRVKKIHKAQNAPIGELVTYCTLPTASVNITDPFLLLNHHGWWCAMDDGRLAILTYAVS